MATEDEEFEFRLRAEREAGQRRSPVQMRQAGFVEGLKEPPDLAAGLERFSTDIGGRVTDLATQEGAPPEIAAARGFGTKVALDVIPTMFGGQAGKAIGVPLRDVSRTLMQSALKPTLKQLQTGEAATAIDTMLERGWNVTRGGVEKIKTEIDKLQTQIMDAIANSPETVDKWRVGRRLLDTLEKFKNQVNPQADIDAIKRAWTSFRTHPLLAGKSEMPVQTAQKLKQGTYKQLAKKYGEMGSADIEAQKTLARGLKEEIAAKVPQIAGLNAEESKLLATLNVTERRALQELNKNPGGLAWLTHNPANWAAFTADKSALFKSLAARLLYRQELGFGAGAGGMTLYELAKKSQEPQEAR